MKPKIFVTRELPKPALERLAEYFEVSVNPDDRVLEKQEIISALKDTEYLLCLLTDQIDAEVMDANPDLKVISNYAVGFNNVDVEAATSRGIPVCNTPGVLTDTTADLAWTLIFATARRAVEGDKFLRAGKFKGWGPLLLLGTDVSHKTLGIVGGGRIGCATAKRAQAFEMEVIYYDPRSDQIERESAARRVEFEELLEQSDFISIHVPLNDKTRHLFGEPEFKRMKSSAILINTARGPIVDEAALAKALKERQIAYAGLDVYEEEPAVHPDLLELDNVVLLPHLGSSTIETRTKMGLLAADNAIAILQGEMPKAIVNSEVLG